MTIYDELRALIDRLPETEADRAAELLTELVRQAYQNGFVSGKRVAPGGGR